ncbi:hypothetical protein TNCV_228621 [Trichonephila clavipes]|nr:hypothetical protein TNCV_228621 [Trichonephila clavipes]
MTSLKQLLTTPHFFQATRLVSFCVYVCVTPCISSIPRGHGQRLVTSFFMDSGLVWSWIRDWRGYGHRFVASVSRAMSSSTSFSEDPQCREYDAR